MEVPQLSKAMKYYYKNQEYLNKKKLEEYYENPDMFKRKTILRRIKKGETIKSTTLTKYKIEFSEVPENQIKFMKY